MPATDHYDDFDDDPDRLGPGEHDAHLLEDDENDTVPCPHCGKQVLATAEHCHRCGASFDNEAWLAGKTRKEAWWWLVAVATLVAFLWVLLG